MSPRIEVMISEDEIAGRINALAKEIAAGAPAGEPLLVLGILKGAAIFAADLVRALHAAGVVVDLDFIWLSSYQGATETSGTVEVLADPATDLFGRDVLLIDDIADTGTTLHFALERIRLERPRSLQVAVLLDKPARRRVKVPLDHVGFPIPDRFVIGYGCDWDQRYRELPYVGVVESV